MSGYYTFVGYNNTSRNSKLPKTGDLIEVGNWCDSKLYTVRVLDILSLNWVSNGNIDIGVELGIPLEYPASTNENNSIQKDIYIDIGTPLKVGSDITLTDNIEYNILAINGLVWAEGKYGVIANLQLDKKRKLLKYSK